MFRAFTLAAAVAAFLVAVLGSWVRINGAGMACPDWPLCRHALVPLLDGAVVLEWSHRLLAVIAAVLVVGALWTGWRARERVAGAAPILAFVTVVFALQVGLGGLTVALANSPWSVVVHWGTAMLLLGGLTALAFLAFVQPRELRRRPSSLDALLGACAGLAFVTMLAGSYVSSSGAGLACTTLPACDGGSWTGTLPGQLAQMAHRFIAGAFFVVATLAAYGARRATPRVRAAALAGYALVIVQVVLGLGAVAWSLPVGLREAHAANACATFLAFVAALTFAAIDGTVPLAQARFDRVRIPAEARIPVEGSAG
jgi:heme A synthase